MVRLADLSETEAHHVRDLPCPVYADSPWAPAPALSDVRLALITTAGPSRRSHEHLVP